MSGLSPDDFDAFHHAVHGVPAFNWQRRLARQVAERRQWPSVLDLPTGSGKTTCVDIALFLLAVDAGLPPRERWCPRRVAMVVDRRLVVDQVAERGRRLLSALETATGGILTEVSRRLRTLSRSGERSLEVYTLRGGMPKDDGWARSPDQPVIIASTVDQLGSRLLMQGYGVSEGMKPVHAGLLSNDLLLLLDEVHLSRPFAQTLKAVTELQARFDRTSGLVRRFQSAFLSATPGENADFGLEEEERAEGSPLGKRLHASKPATLVEATGRSELERSCVQHARALLEEHDVVAVIVNRVGSALTISKQLREHGHEVQLLTGRMRPLDRDDLLRTLRPRIMTGRDRGQPTAKLIVVGTQSIEAGADFDFDALVTEAAPFDGLKQRFGRLDRLGTYGRASAVIIRDREEKADPIYGEAVAETWKWLKRHLDRKQIDWGVLKLPQPAKEEMDALVTPRVSAPVLMPAYVDLWAQTAPNVAQAPDPGLFLHGPRTGPADVQVLWRADLTRQLLEEAIQAAEEGDRHRPAEIVAAIPPSSLESVSLPFVVAKRWLEGGTPTAFTDTAVGEPDDVEAARPTRAGRFALRWRGDDSEPIRGGARLRPGDTLILPAEEGGLLHGCFDPEASGAVTDHAERATLFGRGRALLRSHPVVLAQWGLGAEDPLDAGALRERLREAIDQMPLGDWKGLFFRAVASGRRQLVVDGSSPWLVLHGARVPADRLRQAAGEADTIENGAEASTDEEDSPFLGVEVELDRHGRDVEGFARSYAEELGLSDRLSRTLAFAGWLHDIGKADPRFQRLLRQGSELAALADPRLLAKSALPREDAAQRRRAQRRSGYPRGARHELLSLAFLEEREAELSALARGDLDTELALHLVASHHGYCRPFAPVAEDATPCEVPAMRQSTEAFGEIRFEARSSDHRQHRLDSKVADRFRHLNQRYGWFGLCWLESILRLADHRASEAAQRGDA